jgi:uncharacterized protein (TIGR02145 family)
MKLACILLIFVPISSAFAQQINNVHFEQNNKSILVTYDLSELNNGQTATISLNSSYDAGKTWSKDLKRVRGEVGKGIKPGIMKSITWDVLGEQEDLIGELSFKVTAVLEEPFSSNTGTFIDTRDKKEYKWVKVGAQIWMAENLAYKNINGCWSYENKQENVAKYGYLYSWEIARKICPSGWHLPTDTEWSSLISFVGGESVAGGKLKETLSNQWEMPNLGASNEVGFSALPGGYRLEKGDFGYANQIGGWWTSTDLDIYAWYHYFSYSYVNAKRAYYNKTNGFSVRCVRN